MAADTASHDGAGRGEHRADRQVGHVAREPLDPAHPAGRGARHLAPVRLVRRRVLGRRHAVGVVDDAQVQVVGDVLEVGAERRGEGGRVEAVVGARGGALAQPGGGARAHLGEHEALGHEVGAAGDDGGGVEGLHGRKACHGRPAVTRLGTNKGNPVAVVGAASHAGPMTDPLSARAA